MQYFVLTESLCALEIALGVGERDVIVSNRLLATVSGVILAMIVALLPPQVRGLDPDPMHDLQLMGEDAMTKVIYIILEERDGIGAKIDAATEEFRSKAQMKPKELQFLQKDASKLNQACFFKADPRLSKEMEALSVTGSFVIFWMKFASQIIADEGITLLEAEKNRFKDELNAILECLQKLSRGELHSTNEPMKQLDQMIGSAREEPDVFLATGRFLCNKFEQHERFFASLK